MRNQYSGEPMTNTAPISNYATPTQHVNAGAFSNAPPPNVTPDSSRNIPTFGGLLNALKRRWVLASFIGAIVGCGIGLGVWLAMPAGKHQAKALVKMQPSGLTIPTEDYFKRFKNSQFLTIKSRRLLAKVAAEQTLRDLPMFAGSDDPVGLLEGLVNVKWSNDSEDYLQIFMNGDDPNQLKIILDKFLFIYEQEARTVEEQNRANKVKILESNKENIDKQILDYQKKAMEIIRTMGVGGTVPSYESYIAVLQKMNADITAELQREDIKRRSLEQRIVTLKEAIRVVGNVKVDPAAVNKWLAEQPIVKAKAEAVGIRQEALNKLRAAMPANSPFVIEAEKSVTEANKAFEDAKASMRPQGEREVAESKQRDELSELSKCELELGQTIDHVKALDEVDKQQKAKLDKANAAGVGATYDTEELKPLRDRREFFIKELNALRIDEGNIKPVQIADDVDVRLNQNLKQRIVASLVGAIVGFAGVLALVSYLEWRSRKVDSVDQVMNELGMRVIGTIPAFPSKASLKAGGAEQNQNWRFILNESVNSTRTMLLHTAKTQSMQVIMVTSAMQGEGKTSLSSQLATSMATAGLRTLILDCDLRNPSIHRLFDVALTPGCSEILCQEVDVSDAVQPTSVPNLWMIPAGQCSNRVISALAQGHPLETLFNRLRGQFDFIVVDCCPVLPVADALLIGQHVDGVVFSILQDISQLPKVIDASERLTQLNIPLLGAVVNGIKVDTHAYGYNYVKQLPA